jgi:beta-glucosidase
MDRKAELVSRLTDREKVRMCTGRSFWSLGGAERLGFDPLAVADGPHGLRKQNRDEGYQGAARSVPAVCYPTASAFACSFDPELIGRMGQALGEECRKENVAVLLGPGVNIKRSPLCGRNFEYLSEDPLLSGRLGAALIRGLQSRGVGASLKHFAGNSQETRRMISDSRIGAEALWDIYLKPFEIAVKEGEPWTVMAAYNRLNGIYCCENRWLLEDVLRKEWGFTGTVISDWGAVHRCAASFRNGLDVEMPGVYGDEAYLLEAVKEGRLPKERLDEIAGHVAELMEKHREGRKIPCTGDRESHLRLAAEVAENSAVLLKNEGALPLKEGGRLAVLGQLAKFPRFQGAGSSKVNAVKRDNPLAALKETGREILYAKGYALKKGEKSGQLLEEALNTVKEADQVIIFAGLPEDWESEGFDRTSLALPEDQNTLIREAARIHPGITVVLQSGGPVEMPWIDQVSAVLMSYLSGCQGGHAAAAILTGKVNPSGKLAETFPLRLEDTPCFGNYPGEGRKAEYREGRLVGYRHYDAAEKDVLFPFGHGLSYTRFSYDALQITDRTVSLVLENVGDREGREAVQLYIRKEGEKVRELKAFQKVLLQPGEKKTLTFRLEDRDFARFTEKDGGWTAEPGKYEILIGSSSRDIRLCGSLCMEERKTWPLSVPMLCEAEQEEDGTDGKRPFTINSTLRDFGRIPVLRPALAVIHKIAGKMSLGFISGENVAGMILDQPIRQVPMGTNGRISSRQVKGIVEILNGKLRSGLKKLLGRP